jgi:hypothetical protein
VGVYLIYHTFKGWGREGSFHTLGLEQGRRFLLWRKEGMVFISRQVSQDRNILTYLSGGDE